MSFSDLRSARKSKESKSFVKSVITDAATEDVVITKDTFSAAQDGGSGNSEIVSLENMSVGLPSTLEIRKSAAFGRSMYAKEQFAIGSVLISVKPRITVLSTAFLDSHCSTCCNPATPAGLKRCTRCRTVWYCDAACQTRDWTLHKHECNALQQWAAVVPSSDLSVPSDAVRCLGRMLWYVQKKGADSAWTKELNMMQSHRASLPSSASESYTHLAHFVVRYLGVGSPSDLANFGLSSAGDLVDLISRFTTNTFTLSSFSLTPIGICVAPVVALANHSCEANAAIVFPFCNTAMQEPQMQLIAIRPILQDEQIYISYVDTTLPRDIRQEALRETYNFTCECNLCTSSTASDPRSSVFCPKSCGGICPVPTEENDLVRCTECNAVVTSTDSLLDALRVGQEALDKASALQFKDPTKAKQLTTNIIPILTTAGLLLSSHPLLAMTRLHKELLITSLSVAISQELLDETIRTAAKYSSGLSDTLVYGHPVRGVALAELGKLLAVDEPSPPNQASTSQTRFPPSGPARLKMAYETLLRARDELSIGFGRGNDGGRVGHEVREAIVRLEKELGVWTQGIRDTLKDTRLAAKGK